MPGNWSIVSQNANEFTSYMDLSTQTYVIDGVGAGMHFTVGDGSSTPTPTPTPPTSTCPQPSPTTTSPTHRHGMSTLQIVSLAANGVLGVLVLVLIVVLLVTCCHKRASYLPVQ